GVHGNSHWGVVTSVSIDGVRFCVSWPGQVVTFARLAEVSYTISDTKQGRKELMTATPQEVTGDGAGDGRFGVLPRRPGKIVAVHLSYASRAEQRGRRPAHPSYFFKPSSSVAPSGSTVERPAGTELLAFEGEIALVIGVEARHVSVADAWRHVGWVTASNDLGVYDLRAVDKGSNVRSKGRDGYTPIGPALLDAAAPKRLFPLAQLVADLSQHMTLEVGDVILTGTPAGSSVIGPGDVVEVEVDEPASGATTGRLVTTVVAGQTAFDPALGSLPQ